MRNVVFFSVSLGLLFSFSSITAVAAPKRCNDGLTEAPKARNVQKRESFKESRISWEEYEAFLSELEALRNAPEGATWYYEPQHKVRKAVHKKLNEDPLLSKILNDYSLRTLEQELFDWSNFNRSAHEIITSYVRFHALYRLEEFANRAEDPYPGQRSLPKDEVEAKVFGGLKAKSVLMGMNLTEVDARTLARKIAHHEPWSEKPFIVDFGSPIFQPKQLSNPADELDQPLAETYRKLEAIRFDPSYKYEDKRREDLVKIITEDENLRKATNSPGNLADDLTRWNLRLFSAKELVAERAAYTFDSGINHIAELRFDPYPGYSRMDDKTALKAYRKLLGRLDLFLFGFELERPAREEIARHYVASSRGLSREELSSLAESLRGDR